MSRTVEFRVDVVQAGGKDSFAVLAFIPLTVGGNPNSPGSLAGYGFAKSTTDVLLTKGIQKYFVADDGPTADLRNDNITLVLTLTVNKGNVIITGKALDKANNNAVLWERTVVDTPAAEVLADGQDSPAAPFITTGYFTLYCYEDFSASAPENPYLVYYDNAEVFVTDTTVLDDFNDNTKTDWQDFTFVTGFGLPVETSGQFRFELPPAGQAIFTASQKTSRVFELTEGERLELSVDVVQAGAKDSFAVLAFIPLAVGGNPNSPGSLAGYGFAKSTTDVLLTKGIQKYFVADDGPTADLRNDNITLVLTLTARGGNVIITGKVLDKANNNAVIWERTVVDTPAAEVLADGQDSPAAPFITTGYFTLYCYEDFSASAPENPYLIYYDNAIVSAPPLAANKPPILSEIQPSEFANFLPASTQVSFKVTDDKPLSDEKISIMLNGAKYTSTNGLTVSGSGTTRSASIGALQAQVDYTAILSAEDSDGETISRTIYFDTFAATNLMIEVEDYNFESGKFIDNPAPVAEGTGAPNSYSQQAGVQSVDFNDTRGTPRPQDTFYRPSDPVRMQHTLDYGRQKYVAAGGTAAGVYDYDVGDIAAAEWLNFTRTFAPGSYQVYLRQALANMASGESILEQVTGDPTQPDPGTRVLGSFLGVRSGFQYRNSALTDGLGQNKIILRLGGAATLRLRQVTPDPDDGARYQNYLVFIPVPDAGIQRATVTGVSPAPGSVAQTATPVISATIQNRDTAVRTNTITLTLNGSVVSPTINADTNGAVVTYAISPLPPADATNTAQIVFTDDFDVTQSNEWSFVISYKSLDPANRRPGTGSNRGFAVRVVQAPAGSALENSLQRAEDQLTPNSTIPKVYETNVVEQVINQAKDGNSSGYFADETLVPGLLELGDGTEDFAVEIQAWLELPTGVHRFGVVSDDGYKISSGASLSEKDPVLAFHNGGPANETFEFVVPQAGLYPFRMIWYERGGSAYAEWFSVDPTSGTRTLINDPATPSAIKAYTSVSVPLSQVTILNPHFEGNDFVLSFQSETAKAYTIESSADLNSWGSSGVTATGTGGVLNLPIPSPTAPRTFYRVRTP